MSDRPDTSTEPQRFDLEQPTHHMGSAWMEQSPGYGDWVRYEDYSDLRDDRDALKARAEAAEAQLRNSLSDPRVKALVETAKRLADYDQNAPGARQVYAALAALKGSKTHDAEAEIRRVQAAPRRKALREEQRAYSARQREDDVDEKLHHLMISFERIADVMELWVDQQEQET